MPKLAVDRGLTENYCATGFQMDHDKFTLKFILIIFFNFQPKFAANGLTNKSHKSFF